MGSSGPDKYLEKNEPAWSYRFLTVYISETKTDRKLKKKYGKMRTNNKFGTFLEIQKTAFAFDTKIVLDTNYSCTCMVLKYIKIYVDSRHYWTGYFILQKIILKEKVRWLS